MKRVIDKCWGLYNANNLWCTGRTKGECVEEAVKQSGEPWSKCKKYFNVRKVTITTGS